MIQLSMVIAGPISMTSGMPLLISVAAVEFLAGLSGGGRVLELAIGTGRVALPLAARGIAMEGIDASQAMVDRLRAKPGGDAIQVTIGDMAEVGITGPFRLVYLVFNTLFGLLSQERQANCFRNVARVLEPGGLFVVECFVPDLARFDRGQRVHALAVTEDSASMEMSRHDAVQQRVTTQIIIFDERGMRMQPVALRYSWPGAGFDGRTGRPTAPRTLQRLGPPAVRLRQRRPCFGIRAAFNGHIP